MVIKMLTVLPEGHKSSSNVVALDDANALRRSEVPFRMPSFVSPRVLNNHLFEANGEIYEYDNGQYFRKVATLTKGSSFGEIALQRKRARTASIKTETDCKFMYLTKEAYKSTLMNVKDEME